MQYAGLFLLLLGLAGLFFLWLKFINQRTKVVESDAPEPQAQEPASRFGASSFDLIPQAREAKPSVVASPTETTQTVSEVPEHSEEHDSIDETAATHLAIASQFFDMGDFEGASEMCQLVIESDLASAIQKSTAVQVKALCG